MRSRHANPQPRRSPTTLAVTLNHVIASGFTKGNRPPSMWRPPESQSSRSPESQACSQTLSLHMQREEAATKQRDAVSITHRRQVQATALVHRRSLVIDRRWRGQPQ
eukprot:205910-Prymnesium_polylepis.1